MQKWEVRLWFPTSRIPVEHVLSRPVEAFHWFATMRSGISLLTYSNLPCMMSRWNQISNLWLHSEALAHRTSNASDGARLDISVKGFWEAGGRHEKTFLDVRVFNPHAPSNNNSSIANCYKKHENEKKRAYEQRVRDVEHPTFTPIVFSATGGMAKQSTTFYKRLASRLAEKWEQWQLSLYWLRTHLSFSYW